VDNTFDAKALAGYVDVSDLLDVWIDDHKGLRKVGVLARFRENGKSYQSKVANRECGHAMIKAWEIGMRHTLGMGREYELPPELEHVGANRPEACV
jgi:hypothetical protein